MQGDGDRFEKRSLLEGQIGRKAMNDPGGNRDKFRKGPGAAVVAAGDAENFAAIAKINVSAETIGAFTARKTSATWFSKTMFSTSIRQRAPTPALSRCGSILILTSRRWQSS